MFKNSIIFLFVLSTGLHNPIFSQSKSPSDYVNMHLGTWGYTGGVIPGVGVPFGMTQFCAMTRYPKVGNTCYQYEDTSYVIGFTATHQPAVWMGDYGYVNLMPGLGKPKSLSHQRKMKYSHKNEEAHPYYYKVPLSQPITNQKIMAELAATSKCGLYQFTFPTSDSANIIVEALNSDYASSYIRRGEGIDHQGLVYEQKRVSGYVKVKPETNEIEGYNPDIQSHSISPNLKNFKGYFVIRFNKKFKTSGTWSDSLFYSTQTITGSHVGAFVTFKTNESEIIQVKVGTSFISLSQARENLEKEIPNWNFENVKANAKKTWDTQLSAISITTPDQDYLQRFYTFMFHAHQYPRDITEYGKYYSAAADTIKTGYGYTDFSLWDTFRALHPLLLLTAPQRVNPMIQSIVDFYKESGRLPVWPNPMETNIMIGTHADAVIADAYVKGFKGFDTNTAFKAIVKNGNTPPPNDTTNKWADRDPWTTTEGRGGLTNYIAKGYVAVDATKECVARTLEYAFDDFCIAEMAKKMNKTKEYQLFANRSQNYKNTFDLGKMAFMPRYKNGTFKNDTLEGFTEGNYWVYRFFVPHDVEGLVNLHGTKENLAQLLDLNYSKFGYGQHGNEQVHSNPYIYNYLNQPWKTQETIDKTIATYGNAPWGIGNDDCGQMSAWFVFNTMGFYPACPCKDEYVIGVPQVPKAVVNLGAYYANKTFVMTAQNLSLKNKYIQNIKLNGKPLKTFIIKHQDIIKGGSLEFEMGEKPNSRLFAKDKE